MKNRLTQILIAVILILLSTSAHSFSQVPDDVNGRLWRLAKVWGMAKYYHPNNCNADWNAFALEAIDSILVSGSNQSFNSAIEDLLTRSGEVLPANEPLIHDADTNLNAQFDWIDDSVFGPVVHVLLDSIVNNFRPRENCLVKFNDYTDDNYSGLLSFSNDNLFNVPSFSYAKESHRLLALFYYWNVINYFHADRNLMDQDWDSTLVQFIPLIREADNDMRFHKRFLNLVTKINDTHGFTYSPVLNILFGSKMPLLKIEFVDNQTIVSKIGPQETVINIGDRITKVNGIDIDIYRDSISDYSPASNESALNRDLNTNVLQGQIGTTILFELERLNGEIYNTSLDRNFTFSTYYSWINADPKPTWEVTTCGYGYVNMGKLTFDQVPQMYQDLKDAPAIIFDVRNYPNGTILDLIPYLFSEPIAFAIFGRPDLTYPGWYDLYDNLFQSGSFSNTDPYAGKVIILVNAETQSHAEFTVMALQQHPNAFTIGSQTAGADGNVSNVVLPGYLETTWTSLGVFYPDSTNAQRVGVKIDSIVKPTREDIILGRDAVLLAAFECFPSSDQETIQLLPINIHPSPAETNFFVATETALQGDIIIEAYNQIGQKILDQSIPSNELNYLPINVSGWMNGIYFINLRNENGILASEKIIVQH